jgi:hypothetical protein
MRHAKWQAHTLAAMWEGLVRVLALVTFVVVLSAASPVLAQQDSADQLTTYQRVENGLLRTFNFDGDTPFVNPRSGQSDIATIAFDGGVRTYWQINNAGSGTGHIAKVLDPAGFTVTRIRLLPQDSGAGGYRTQVNSHHIEPYKTYVYELEFKLDPDWDFGMRNGGGLIWQLKGSPRPGQWGNPSLALNLGGNQLALSIKYPRSAMNAGSWPARVSWSNGEYTDAPVSARTVVAGRYHRIRILFFADDRPGAFGGRGRVDASFDGLPWVSYEGPTLHPDQAGPHRIDFGWYQWEGKPDAVRTVYFRIAHLHELKKRE